MALDSPTIRDASEGDLDAIVEIYNAAIPGRLATADTEPVSVESRWLSFGKFNIRPGYAPTAEVSVYVAPTAHRTGVATRLMERALTRAPALGLKTFLGLVFAHNHPSVELCRRFGFETWGHLPRVAVLDGVERDVLILGRRLDRGG